MILWKFYVITNCGRILYQHKISQCLLIMAYSFSILLTTLLINVMWSLSRLSLNKLKNTFFNILANSIIFLTILLFFLIEMVTYCKAIYKRGLAVDKLFSKFHSLVDWKTFQSFFFLSVIIWHSAEVTGTYIFVLVRAKFLEKLS